MKSAKDSTNPTITINRKARYDYHLRDRYEAGVVLQGTEVKAIRAGRFNLTDSHAQVAGGEVFLIDAHIGPYEHGNIANHEPKRKRKLLLNRREITKLEQFNPFKRDDDCSDARVFQQRQGKVGAGCRNG